MGKDNFEAETNEFDVEVEREKASAVNHDLRMLIAELTKEAASGHRAQEGKIEAAINAALKAREETYKRVLESERRAHEDEMEAERLTHKAEIMKMREENVQLRAQIQCEKEMFEAKKNQWMSDVQAKKEREFSYQLTQTSQQHTEELMRLMREKEVAKTVSDMTIAELKRKMEVLESKQRDHEAHLKDALEHAKTKAEHEKQEVCHRLRVEIEKTKMEAEEARNDLVLDHEKAILAFKRELREKERDHKIAFDQLEQEVQASISKMILTRGGRKEDQ